MINIKNYVSKLNSFKKNSNFFIIYTNKNFKQQFKKYKDKINYSVTVILVLVITKSLLLIFQKNNNDIFNFGHTYRVLLDCLRKVVVEI